jgi:CheY-like chemotaxis protein
MEKLNCILLIDDDTINNFINENLLRKLDISEEVVVRKNGQDGLDFVEDFFANSSKAPELILLDINMPVIDGFEFLKKIKKFDFINLESTQVIILTTSTSPKDIEKMSSEGINNYLNKPLTEEKLNMVLKNHPVFE